MATELNAVKVTYLAECRAPLGDSICRVRLSDSKKSLADCAARFNNVALFLGSPTFPADVDVWSTIPLRVVTPQPAVLLAKPLPVSALRAPTAARLGLRSYLT